MMGRSVAFSIAVVIALSACSNKDATEPSIPDHLYHAAINVSGTAGAELGSVTVSVLDAKGFGIPNVDVTWAATDDGIATPTSSTTNSSGEATVIWTLGPSAAAQTITASVTGIPSLT